MSKKFQLRVGIGASSILMIILTLALTSFAVLSLVSAQSDSKLTDKTKIMMTEYYTADEKTEALLARIDAVLINNADAANLNDELGKLNETLHTDENGLLSFVIPVNDNRQIAVTIRILDESALRYEIISRKLESVGDWDPETDIEPWIK